MLEGAIGLYSAGRSIIDASRLRHQEGADLAYEALRRWLRRRDASPAALIDLAQGFPKALPALLPALEILLRATRPVPQPKAARTGTRRNGYPRCTPTSSPRSRVRRPSHHRSRADAIWSPDDLSWVQQVPD